MRERGLLELSRRDLLLLEAIELISRLLRDTALPAVLIGGHAVNTWYRPRFTDDLDFTVAADRAAISALRVGLEASGFAIRRNQDHGEENGPDFLQLKHPVSEIVVDLLVAKTPFQDRLLARAIPTSFFPFGVATPEDLIILKLIANRSIDQVDVVHLASAEGIDWDYISAEAPAWQIEDRLAALKSLVGRTA